MREQQWLLSEGRKWRDGQQGTALWFLPRLLFSFSLGSEVLFGLVFGALVQKRDFCSMGTGSLVDPFLPFLYCFCLIHCEGEQKQVVKYRVTVRGR